MKKNIFIILSFFNFAFALPMDLMYKCSNNKPYIYYKNMNNKGNYNGWFLVSNFECIQGKTTLQADCDQAGQLHPLDQDGNLIQGATISGVNCSSFNLNFPQSTTIM